MNNFREQYRKEHECCPKCGAIEYSTTLVGYILVVGHEDEYKNKNACVCSKCGDRHIMHDRVPKDE